MLSTDLYTHSQNNSCNSKFVSGYYYREKPKLHTPNTPGKIFDFMIYSNIIFYLQAFEVDFHSYLKNNSVRCITIPILLKITRNLVKN